MQSVSLKHDDLPRPEPLRDAQLLRPAPPEPELPIDLWAHLDIIWARRYRVLLGVLVAVVTAAAGSMLAPKQYRTVATVFVTPPTYATTLRPETLSVEAYEKLAESDYMIGRVEASLRKTRPDLFGDPSATGRLAEYDATLFSSREPQKPYLPLLGLTGKADSPEKAQLVANTWASVFVTEQGKLSEIGKSTAADFILVQYPEAERGLAASEVKLQEVSNRHAQALARLEAEVGLSLKRKQQDSYELLVVTLEQDLSKAKSALSEVRPTVVELEKELEKVPPHLEVNKAVTDDALWNAITQAGGDRKAVVPLENSRLKSSEINPVHTGVRLRLAEARVKYNALIPHIASLEKQITETRARAGEVRNAMFEGERRISDLKRAQETEAAELKRSVNTAKFSYDKLAERVGEALIAKKEPDTDLKLGALAEVPRAPSSPRRLVNVFMSGLIGFLLSVALVWAAEQVKAHAMAEAAAAD